MQELSLCADSITVRKIEEKKAESEVVTENSARLKREVEDVSAEILEVSERMRQANRVLSSVGKNLTELREKKQDLVDVFWQASSPGTREGYATIMEANLPGVHGLLLEHISVPEEYRLAVEVTAGPQLFNILVDDEEVMGRCMDLLEEKASREWQIIQSYLHVSRGDSLADSIPLTDVIESPDWVRCVVQRVWGRFILVTGATEGPAGLEFSTVTREGDIFSRNGLLEGGFFDPQRCTRLEEERVSRVNDEIKLLEDRLENVTANLLTERSAEKNLKQRLLSIRVNLQRNLRAEAVKGRQLSELRDARQRLSDSIYLATRLSREYDAEQKSLELEIAAIEAERKSPVTDTGELTEADAVQLENLLRDAILATTEEKQDDLEKERRIRWLAGELTEIEQNSSSPVRGSQSYASYSHPNGMEAEVADLEASVANLKGAYDEKTNEIRVYEERHSLADTKLDDIIAHQPDVDNLDDAIREMTDDTPQLRKRLLKCARAVSRFASVNNKAAEQFGEFNGQYEDLLQKQREMDEGQAAIDDLIRSLDAEKKDNIVKSFAQINENFSGTFSALVPDGSAKMKLLRRSHTEEDGEDTDSTTSSMTEDEYVGVALEVTFSRSRSRMKRMYELSGGQKTVVAVALLFAMQKTEQPPFYLFDEIDAALDPQYREAVARLVASVANPESGAPAQVICTTFHSELCQVADRHYRVSINDCSSSVAVINGGCQHLL
ncbi:Structural maintenance of chromosomes protein 3 [Perkinsus olseni]|uniref:Structural maintenance of chromosomes protein 3 n=1 Tax=Perkinsus olseni TaxID=32597 RepID=A0A7J6PDF9_PEROL|nr:Structural maintenance of chromosomes protein 3 [Perkinsus olseni]